MGGYTERSVYGAPTWGIAEQDGGESQDAIAIDRRLRDCAQRRAADDYQLGLLLRRGFVLRVHDVGGFGSFREYAERLFGFTGRQTEERLRVAEALERLPGLSIARRVATMTFSTTC